MQPLTLAIIGGTGFVGGHLVARLAKEGHVLRVLTRSRERNRKLLVLPTVNLIQANIYDADTLQQQFTGCDAVINLVGIINEKGRDGSGFARAHVELPRLIVAACKAAGVRRLLHMSALKASATDGPSHYLRTKGEAENLIRRDAASDINVTLFSPSIIFGPDDNFTNRFADMVSLPLPAIALPRPNARFAPVFVGDVVEAFVRCLGNSASWGKTYQLCGPQVYSLRELIGFLATIRGVRIRIFGMPASLARLAARVGDFLPGKPFSTDNYQSLSVHSICETNGLTLLGIKPTPLGSVVPGYIAGRTQRQRLSAFRKVAGR